MREDLELDYYLSLKAAWHYYMNNKTQQEIADIMNISRMRVVKLLDKAREMGIIQFHIRTNMMRRIELERKLIDRWGLEDAFILPIDADIANVDEELGRAAAMYLSDQIREDTFINWGHGRTLNRALSDLLQMCEYHLSIISLTGGVDYYLPNASTNFLKAKIHVIPAPLIVSSAQVAQIIRQERPVKEIFDMIWHSSMTVIGIGGMGSQATMLQRGTMSANDFLLLSMQGAVGDILSQFIDSNGNKIHSSFDDCMVSISLDVLKQLNNVIAIAGGVSKAPAIRAALQGGYLNKLVIDEETAKLLLD